MRSHPILLVAAVLALNGAADPPPEVNVTGGTVIGARSEDGALVFRGIPYAAPPLGERRWRAPGAVIPWQGGRAVADKAPACLQNDYGWNHADYLHSAEDCLTLDVRTRTLQGRLPVMVWIHGGSNRAGSARGTVDSHITSGGVVLVAIQYRLGILGFLPHRGAAAEAGGHAGNYGLMDQIAALRWVQTNIARFGGDPANVTIFGESAGSQDVSLLLAAPQARGLFAKAILESGTPGFGMPFRSLEQGLAIGDQADKLLDSGGSISALRGTSVQALLAADLKLADPSLSSNDFMWLKTGVDGAVLPESPRVLLARAPRRAVIIGSSRAEFGPAEGSTKLAETLRKNFGANADAAQAFYRFGAPDRRADPRLGYPELELSTDTIFRCPAGRMAQLLSGAGTPVWRYEFDLAQDGGRSSHGSELPYVFGDAKVAGALSLQSYWLNFARTGDPNGPGLPQWPRFEPKAQRHVTFEAAGVTVGARLREPVCALLKAL